MFSLLCPLEKKKIGHCVRPGKSSVPLLNSVPFSVPGRLGKELLWLGMLEPRVLDGDDPEQGRSQARLGYGLRHMVEYLACLP